MPKKLTQEEVINRCKKIHPEYNYDKLIYVNANTPFIVTCPIHGDFETRASRFIMGSKCGCPKCNTGFIKYVSSEEFKRRCIEQFPNYDYSKANFKGEYDKITVTCNIHNYTWNPTTKDLMNGHGCPLCGRESLQKTQALTLQEFIQKAREIHRNKYDYSKVDYYNSSTPITINCPKHGEFQTTPNSHLSQKTGCPRCKQSKGESDIELFLDEKQIQYVKQYPIVCNLKKNNKTYVDFYLPEYNTFIEYNGQQHYIPIKYFGGELKFREQVARDEYVRNYCKANAIKLIEIKYDENVVECLGNKLR